MNYWIECISEAFDEAGITATDEQIKNVAECVKGAHENYSLATGEECIPNPLMVTVDELKSKCKKLESDVERERMNFKQNIAMRNHCSVNDVELTGGGHAMIRG